MSDDARLLESFLKGDEAAFRLLVTRHFDLVYSTALRQLNGDAHQAEDVAQTVLTDLARKAPLLFGRVVLSGWLYEATRFAAAKVVRSEQRRRAREQQAMSMQDTSTDTAPEWEQLQPVLDAAVGQLGAKDRNAILLHYFEHKNFRAVGAALGVSDDAAQKRVSRALGKLRILLTKRGVAASAASLAALLSAQGVHAAPPGLALSVANTSLAEAAAAGPVSAGTVLLKALTSFKAQLVAGLALALLLSGGVVQWAYSAHLANQRQFRTVRLLGFYNGSLRSNWTPAYGPENNLAALGTGRRVLKGVPFDIRGVVQLQGELFKERGYVLPERIEGIPVGWTASKIHLLHANSGYADPPGTRVASLVLHYADGQRADLPILQQVHLLDWWEWRRAAVKLPSDTNTVVAWRGSNGAAEEEGATIRLFDTTFTNPEPGKEIQALDYVSAMTNGAPFLVAITLER